MASPRLPRGPQRRREPEPLQRCSPLNSLHAAQAHLRDQFGDRRALAVLRNAAHFGDLASGAFDSVRSHSRTIHLRKKLEETRKALMKFRSVAPKNPFATQIIDQVQQALVTGLIEFGHEPALMVADLLLSLPPAQRDAAEAELRSIVRKGERVRRLFMLLRAVQGAEHFDPRDLAAIFLCIGFRNEGPLTEQRAIDKRLDLWAKAHTTAVALWRRWNQMFPPSP